jgi:hypothetical protein
MSQAAAPELPPTGARRLRPAAPLWPLLPALVLLPLALLLPRLLHGGGFDLVGQFALAALRPSLDPLVLGSVLGRQYGPGPGAGHRQLPGGVAHGLEPALASGTDPAPAGRAALDP